MFAEAVLRQTISTSPASTNVTPTAESNLAESVQQNSLARFHQPRPPAVTMLMPTTASLNGEPADPQVALGRAHMRCRPRMPRDHV